MFHVHPTSMATIGLLWGLCMISLQLGEALECGPGQYLDGTCKDCPRGTYQPLASTGTEEDPFARACKLCTPGYRCSLRTSSPARTCTSGYYCPTGNTYDDDAHTCPPTFYCPAGSGVPTPCPSGTISPPGSTSSDSCTDDIPCPPGQYKSADDECTDCPAGTFQPSWVYGDINYCQPCPPGSYCITKQLDEPSGPCVFPGYYCPTRSVSPVDTKCPAGFYCPGTSVNPIACPIRMTSEPGAAYLTDCSKVTLDCSPGYIAEGMTCTPCPDGTYASTDECVACPAGKYCAGQANAAPTGLCSAGYYCPEGSISPTAVLCPEDNYCTEESATPTQCPSGTRSYLGSVGSSSCSNKLPALCAAGYYNDGGTCKPCLKGYYKPTKDRAGVDSCLPCTPGHHCSSTGMKAPISRCNDGYFCPLGSRFHFPIVCPHDFYCPSSSGAPLPCPDGKQSPPNSYSISQCI